MVGRGQQPDDVSRPGSGHSPTRQAARRDTGRRETNTQGIEILDSMQYVSNQWIVCCLLCDVATIEGTDPGEVVGSVERGHGLYPR